jgi:hypothetical protein
MLYPPNKPEFQEQTLRLFYWDWAHIRVSSDDWSQSRESK